MSEPGTTQEPLSGENHAETAGHWTRREYVSAEESGPPVSRTPLPDDVSDQPTSANEAAYLEKIVARKCLNTLVDIRVGLSRQNKLLETIIRECELARQGADGSPSVS